MATTTRTPARPIAPERTSEPADQHQAANSSKTTTLGHNGAGDEHWLRLEAGKTKEKISRPPMSASRFNERTENGARATASSQEQWETMSKMTSWRRLAQGAQPDAVLALKFDRVPASGSEKLIAAQAAASEPKCQLHGPLNRIIMGDVCRQPAPRAHLHGNEIITPLGDTCNLPAAGLHELDESCTGAGQVQCETMARSSSTTRERARPDHQFVHHKLERRVCELGSAVGIIRRRVWVNNEQIERRDEGGSRARDDTNEESNRSNLRRLSRGPRLVRVGTNKWAKSTSMWPSWRQWLLLLAATLLLTSLLASFDIDLLRRSYCLSSPDCNEQKQSVSFAVSAATASERPPLGAKKSADDLEPMTTEQTTATLSAPTLASTPASKSNASEQTVPNEQATSTKSTPTTLAVNDETPTTLQPILQQARQTKPKKSIQPLVEFRHKQQAIVTHNMHNSSAIKSLQLAQNAKWQAIVAPSKVESSASGQEAFSESSNQQTFGASGDKTKMFRAKADALMRPAEIVIGRRPGAEEKSAMFESRTEPRSYIDKLYDGTKQQVPSPVVEPLRIHYAIASQKHMHEKGGGREPLRPIRRPSSKANEHRGSSVGQNSSVSQTLRDWTIDSGLSSPSANAANDNSNQIIQRQHSGKALNAIDNVQVGEHHANSGGRKLVEQLDHKEPLASALKEVLDDLATSAAGDQLVSAAGRQSVQRAFESHQLKQRVAARSQFDAPLIGSLLNAAEPQAHHQVAPSAMLGQMPLLDLKHFRQTLAPIGSTLIQTPKTLSSLQSTASHSAPSISLPPISHFLSPRNPFRLFASASTPISTRYWPHLSAGGQSGKQSRRWFGAAGPAQSQPSGNADKSALVGAESGNRPTSGSAFQGNALNNGRDLLTLQDIVSAPISSSSAALYAHSHSAEQLEKLVRAASQAGHITGSPPILPAIVSGLNGQTLPGFYIPAIEPLDSSQSSGSANNAQESQISELIRHHGGQAVSASTQAATTVGEAGGSLSSSNGFLSTIPGTDYILHPDEVRAMIDIGESAWRKSQQQADSQQQHGSHEAASNVHQHQMGAQLDHDHPFMFHADSSLHQPMGPPIWPQGPNLMQENHMENLRNYAYVDSTDRYKQASTPSASAEHLQGASSGKQQQRYPFQQKENGTSVAARQLGEQLNRALARAQSRNLPAIIRVNDQDYIHWPLIQMQETERKQRSRVSENSMSAASGIQQQQLLPPSAATQQQQVEITPKLAGVGPDQLNRPVRLATQLTPHEIRQVEDSILETLIMAQTMQHQRKIMEALVAAASQPQRQIMSPGSPKWQSQNTKQKGRSGFFSRRRRRRNSAAHNKARPNGDGQSKRGQEQKPARLASSRHLVGLTPLMGAVPLGFYPLLPPAVASFSSGVEQTDAMMPGLRNEQARGESQLVQRLPAVMADQETNKPRVSSSYSEQLISAADSTGALRARVSDATDGLFGARMSAAKRQPTSTATRKDPSPKEDNQTFASRQMRAQPAVASTQAAPTGSAAKDQYVTFVPMQNNREKQISLYQGASGHKSAMELVEQPKDRSERGQNQVAASSSNRPSRISVDWPAMVSDADYFPTERPLAATRGVNGLQPIASNEPSPNTMRGQSDRLRASSSNSSRKKSFLPSSSDDELEDVDEHRHAGAEHRRLASQRPRAKSALMEAAATMSIIQPEATHRGNFVTSQMKLQFAQDYQAREGVPIYNNNVRVAGALDRERSLHAPASRTRSASDEDSNADETVLMVNRTASPEQTQASNSTTTTTS